MQEMTAGGKAFDTNRFVKSLASTPFSAETAFVAAPPTPFTYDTVKDSVAAVILPLLIVKSTNELPPAIVQADIVWLLDNEYWV